MDEANANYPQVSQLIDQAGPFLQAQIRAGGDIKSLADGLARFTWQLRAADPRLRDTLADAPDAIDEANTAFSDSSFVSRAGGQSGQPGPGGRDLSQVDRTAPGGFPGAVRRDHHLGGRRTPGRGRQAGLQDRPARPAALHDRVLAPPLVRSPADESVREIPGTCTARPRRTTRARCAALATTRARNSR